MNTLVEYFLRGGPIMWPILLLSILSWAIMLERTVRLRRGCVISDELVASLRASFSEGNINAARQVLQSSKVLMAPIVSDGIEEYLAGKSDIDNALQGAAERKLRVLWSNMLALNTIARVATLLGLLGTVMGMVMGFDELSKEGVAKEKLAQAIGIALITTVGGLVVAIPAVIGESAFKSRIHTLTMELEEDLTEIVTAVRAGLKR